MPRIDADAPLQDDFMRSSMIYGVSRAGKTVFLAGFPRPAIFASEREGGYRSIQTMDVALRYERNVKPIIYAVASIRETMPYFKEVEQMVRRGQVRTIGIELSFYSDDVVRALSGDDEKNGWVKYKLLDDHIQWLDAAAKKLGVRIAYNALAADPGDIASKAPAGVQLAGKALARKLPATTDLTGYLRAEDAGSKTDRVLHLAAYGAFPAGHRYGVRLPTTIRNPTFRKLEDIAFGRATVDSVGNVIYPDGGELPPL